MLYLTFSRPWYKDEGFDDADGDTSETAAHPRETSPAASAPLGSAAGTPMPHLSDHQRNNLLRLARPARFAEPFAPPDSTFTQAYTARAVEEGGAPALETLAGGGFLFPSWVDIDSDDDEAAADRDDQEFERVVHSEADSLAPIGMERARRSRGSTMLLCCVMSGGAAGFTVPHAVSRRQAVGLGAAAGAFIASTPLAAHASMDPNDMSRFKKALKGVDFLLANWEQETQECTSKGEGICSDSPDKVRYYFGLRTTDHPLFQLDKLYAKAQDKLPDDVDFEQWIEATESLASQIAKINELAYTSSFGEYNPGGGKEQVRKYLLLCKEQVEMSKSSLETIVKLLNI